MSAEEPPVLRIPPEVLAEVRELAERELTREEFEAYVNAPVTPEEERNLQQLLAWFARRYPTASERLAYARRAHTRWSRGT